MSPVISLIFTIVTLVIEMVTFGIIVIVPLPFAVRRWIFSTSVVSKISIWAKISVPLMVVLFVNALRTRQYVLIIGFSLFLTIAISRTVDIVRGLINKKDKSKKATGEMNSTLYTEYDTTKLIKQLKKELEDNNRESRDLLEGLRNKAAQQAAEYEELMGHYGEKKTKQGAVGQGDDSSNVDVRSWWLRREGVSL